MGNPTCPKCGKEVRYFQLMRHTWKKPITCFACGARMNFDRKAWHSMGVLSSIPVVTMILIQFFGKYLFTNEALIILLTTNVVILIITALWIGVRIAKIKLVLITE